MWERIKIFKMGKKRMFQFHLTMRTVSKTTYSIHSSIGETRVLWVRSHILDIGIQGHSSIGETRVFKARSHILDIGIQGLWSRINVKRTKQYW